MCVIEKASTIGAQILSGAVIEPQPLDALLPGWRDNPPPICVPAGEDEFWLLSKTGARKLPVPPGMNNHGNFIVSLGAMCAWMAPQAEALGVDVFPGFAAADNIYNEDGSVAGVRIGDMGVAKDGSHKPGYTEGIDIKAKVTVLAEGARGSLTKQLIKRFKLDARTVTRRVTPSASRNCGSCRPAASRPARSCTASAGRPTATPTAAASCITWTRIASRSATSAASTTATRTTSRGKRSSSGRTTRSVKPLLEGGTILSAGARAIVTGGYQSLPKLEMPGALLIGDTAGLLNVPKIKGTHQAIKSGMLAAEHLAANDLSPAGFDAKLRASDVMTELKKVRNIKPAFKKGLWFGMLNAAWETVIGGASPWTLKNKADWSSLHKLGECEEPKRDYVQRTLPPRDRLAGVYFAATEHDEDQPIHLHVADTSICVDQCATEYGNPCTRFCPAGVYEIVDDATPMEAGKRLQINAANCVHCKTCDIKDPYEIITWVTPEGGSGPNYQNL